MKQKTENKPTKSLKAFEGNWKQLKAISLITGETMAEILERIVPVELSRKEKKK